MRIRTLLFATYRDMAGTESIELDLPPGATAADLVRRLRANPGLERLPAEPALAVNEEYAPLTTRLADGDEVALLPPAAGG
jgi:molybdopterin converting factor small subunit